MLQAILFDCDGVLFDSGRANIEFFNAVMAAAGQPRLDAEGERLALSLAGPQLVQRLFGHDPELAAHVSAVGSNLDYTPYFDRMHPVADLFPTLERLRQRYRLAMATNRGSTVTRVVERFGLAPYLEIAVGTLDVPRPKPFPDMLEKCLRHFSLGPREALYVGDSPSDYEAARAAGIAFVGIGQGTGCADWLPGVGALPAFLESGADELQWQSVKAAGV